MAREIFHRHYATGANLYAVIHYKGMRWDGSTFVTPTVAALGSGAVALTEDAGTYFYAADVPAGITVQGRLDYWVHVGGVSPAVGDAVAKESSVIWDGAAETAFDTRHDPSALCQGVVEAATSNTLTLASGNAPAQALSGVARVEITGGQGVGQAAMISAYDVSTRVATIEGSWWTVPNTSSRYAVYWRSNHPTTILGGADAAGLDLIGSPQSGDAFALLSPFEGAFLAGQVTAASSSSTFTVMFTGTAPGAAELAGAYCSFTSSDLYPCKVQIASAVSAGPSSRTITLVEGAPLMPTAATTVLIG